MKCSLIHHNNPFLRLGPFKYEALNKHPEVGYVHDLISDNNLRKMKLDAIGKMTSTPYTVKGNQQGYSRLRTSKVMYINERLNANAMKISKNIELVTNLVLSKNQYDSENFQVGSKRACLPTYLMHLF